MVDNHEFTLRVKVFKSHVEYFGYRAARALEVGGTSTTESRLNYIMQEAKTLSVWVAPWLGNNGANRAPESFLELYKGLVLRRAKYALVEQEGIAGSTGEEFSQHIAKLMDELVRSLTEVINNTEFNKQLEEMRAEFAHMARKANNQVHHGIPKTEVTAYRYWITESSGMVSWFSTWLDHPGTARTPGSFLLFYSALVLKNDDYAKAGVPEHKIHANREFAKYTARLMETLVRCVS